MRAQHVGGDLQVDRPGLAQVAHGARHRLVELAQDLFRHPSRAGEARHRAQDIDVRDVLERSHVGLRPRGAAADQQHRRPGERGVGHAGDGVGHARPGGRQGDAELSGQLGMRVRHVDGGTLVAHVDDADALARGMVPDRLDVAALQAEDAVDASRHQEPARSRPHSCARRR